MIQDLKKEIRDELIENAETFVIRRCQENYKNLLMTGPFSCDEFTKQAHDSGTMTTIRGRRNEDDIIPDRPRCTVMGVILQQIDANNSVVTVAIVDKQGELIAHKDLQRMMPPRKFIEKATIGITDEEV
jgi:transcriptional accessory protein Tex/SPT6